MSPQDARVLIRQGGGGALIKFRAHIWTMPFSDGRGQKEDVLLSKEIGFWFMTDIKPDIFFISPPPLLSLKKNEKNNVYFLGDYVQLQSEWIRVAIPL